MSDSSWSVRLAKSCDGIDDVFPLRRTPWRTARSQSFAVKPRVTLPSPDVRLGAIHRPTSAMSITAAPPRSLPWHPSHDVRLSTR